MIYVECKPDFILLKSITNIPRRRIVHELKGKYEICKRLGKQQNCKGLIDEDPLSIQPSYIQRLDLAKDCSKHDLKVLHDSSNNNYLIVLCPRLEEWILKAAREAGIDVKNYNLPNTAARLHTEININLGKFQDLVKGLKNSSRLKTLKRLLQER